MVKRDVADTLRRGLDNALVNWPTILLRLAEKVVLGVTAIAALIAALAPIAVSLGLHMPESPEDVLDAIVKLYESWVLLAWLGVGAVVLLFVFLAVHSFVEAGCARIAVDGDRAAGPAAQGLRARFRVFSMTRWLAGATDGCWRVFAIYNLVWGRLVLVLFIPLVPTAVLMVVLRDNQAGVITVGIVGLVLTLLLFVIVAIVAGLWTNRAIAEWAARRATADAALSVAWSALKLDLARHVLIALAIFVVSIAGSSFFSTFGAFAAVGHSLSRTTLINFVTMPMRMAGWMLGSAFAAAVASWFLAAYAAIAVEQ